MIKRLKEIVLSSFLLISPVIAFSQDNQEKNQDIDSPQILITPSNYDSLLILKNLLNHAFIFYSEGNFSDSHNLFEHALGYTKALIKPDMTQALIYGNLGYLDCIKGDYKKAIKSYRESHKLNPNNPYYMNGLAFCLAKEDMELDKALSLADSAAKLESVRSFFNTLGLVQYKLKNYEEALLNFKKV